MTATRLSAILLVLASSLLGCGLQRDSVRGNGHLTTETRSVADFSQLVVEGSMQVFLSQGPLAAARITAESNIQPYLTLTHEGDRLTVGFRDLLSVITTRPIQVYLTVPDPNALTVTGSGAITTTDTLQSTGKIALRLTGSGTITVDLHAPEVSCDLTGSGDITAAGETRALQVTILGSGNFRAARMKSETSRVKIAGSGDATLYTSIKLHADILGSGNLYYRGDPALETSIVGSGKAIKKTE